MYTNQWAQTISESINASFAHNPKCSAGIQESGVRIQNRDVSYENYLFFVAVTKMLFTNQELQYNRPTSGAVVLAGGVAIHGVPVSVILHAVAE